MSIRFYANGIDFKDLPVVQNEVGKYYMFPNSSYWKPKLKDFNDAIGKPSNATAYYNGSHVSYKRERALDFSVVAGTNVTCSHPTKLNSLLYSRARKVCGLELVAGNMHPIKYHVKTNKKPGQWIDAGDIIYTVMSRAENIASGIDVFPHIHAGSITAPSFDNTSMRDLILAEEVPVPTIEKMDLQPLTVVEVVTGVNLRLRETPALNGKEVNKFPAGTQAIVRADNPQNVVADGYEWSPVKVNASEPNVGWIAVQSMTQVQVHVKVIALPPNPVELLKKSVREQALIIQEANNKILDLTK